MGLYSLFTILLVNFDYYQCGNNLGSGSHSTFFWFNLKVGGGILHIFCVNIIFLSSNSGLVIRFSKILGGGGHST